MSSTDTATLTEKLTAILTDAQDPQDPRSAPGERPSLATRTRYVFVIRRFEFMPVILTVALAPALLGAHSWGDFLSLNMLLAMLYAISGMQIGNMTNALADREQDALYKSRQSEAIYGLGVSRVVVHIVVSTVVCSALATILAIRTGHWDLLLIAAVVGILGFQYSVPPLKLKSAGAWQLPTLQLSLVFLPGLFVLRSYEEELEWGSVVTLAGFALALVSLFVTSHAEDYLEDEQFGVRTYTVAWGLTRTMYIQSTMLFVGALLMIWSVYATFGFTWALVPLVVAWLLSQRLLFTVVRDVRGATMDAAIAALHKKSLIGPYHAALVGWMTVLLAVFVLIGR
ncbi:UbiA family prenyltransferase [Streptomyces niveus]|uniref:UbiA family prenyltransferase n=1 Tax=Streptomyces niveus TaxID=193462 RepID=UPI0034085C23